MDESQAKEQIATLSQRLHELSHAYYQTHASIVSDRDFDKMLSDLMLLEKQFPEFKLENSPSERVGGTISKEFKTIEHKYPMLSLSNTYSFEDLVAFDNRVQKELEHDNYEYICELKYDGVALSVTYEKGALQMGVTRGDGKQGDEITANIKTIKSLPIKLQNQDLQDFEVRGEIFFPLKEFNRVNEEREILGDPPFANPRNAASGSVKMQDSSIVASRNLDCYIYGLLGEGLAIKSHEEALVNLKDIGFNVPTHYEKCHSIEAVKAYIDKWELARHDLPLETDGIVVKINDYQQQEQLGYTAKSPKWAIAYKYESESAVAKLEEVTYQVGRTGSITPVANLSPVELAGTTVKRASLHNANEIERLDLHEGDHVHVEKGGEIIPKITGVDVSFRKLNTPKIEFISACPECNAPLIREEGEANHYCPNQMGCPPQITGRIEHFIHRKAMNIDGLGSETIELLFKQGLVNKPSDLFSLTYDQIIDLDRFAEKSAENLIQSIQESKTTPFHKVLFGIGIRFVGATVAEKLATHFESIDTLMEANEGSLLETPEIGHKIAQSILNFFQDQANRDEIENLRKANLSFQMEQNTLASDVLEGKSFVISGVFKEFSRDEIKTLIKDNGGKVVSSISAKLSFLVAGDKMGPSKLEKAQKLDVTLISEQEFKNMISS